MKIGKIHRILAYLAAAVAVVSVILAGICRLLMQDLGITANIIHDLWRKYREKALSEQQT